jgi:Protein of unknown function (DUF3119)
MMRMWSLRSIQLLPVLLLSQATAFVPFQQQYHDGGAFAVRQRQQRSTTGSSSASSASSSSRLQANFFDNLFSKTTAVFAQKAPPPKKKILPPPVVIDRDYRVAVVFLAAGLLLDFIPYMQFLLGIPLTLLGLLFLVQTYRVRFVFDEENNLSIRIGDELKESGENVVVGGANVWSCDTIVNYDFFPKGWIDNTFPLDIPILVYFKETQTDASMWDQAGPGKTANDPAKIAAGTAVAGQVHFFPAVCNAQQIRNEFVKRQCGKIET